MKPEPLQGESQRVNMSSPLVSATNKGKNSLKQPTIISLLDSDDDDDVVLVGSSKPAPKAAPPQSEQVWKKMNITEKMDALKRERKCLRKAHETCTNEGHKKLIMTRRNELRGLSAGLHFKIWEPPSPSLFNAIPFHKYEMSEALRATIKAPASRAPEPSTQAESSATVGPLGVSGAPLWPPPPPGSGTLTGSVDNDILSSSTRPPADMSGRAADALQAVNSTFGGLVNSMKSFAEGAGNLFNNALAVGGIGPTITGLPGPSTFPGGLDFLARRAQLEEEFGYEHDRPAE